MSTRSPGGSRVRAAAENALGSAMMSFLLGRTFPVVDMRTPDRPSGGSGTLVKVGGYYLVATAAHVVEGVPPDRIWVAANDLYSQERPRVVDVKCRGGAAFSERLDLAIVELNTLDVERLALSSVSLEQVGGVWNQDDVDETSSVAGYPDALIQAVDKNIHSKCLVTLTGPYGTEPGENIPTYGFPDVDASLHEDSVYLSFATTPRPAGISGGGIWATEVNSRRGKVWTPNHATLVGVVRSNNLQDGFVRGTRIERWMEMVWEEYPLLRNIVDQRLREVTPS